MKKWKKKMSKGEEEGKKMKKRKKVNMQKNPKMKLAMELVTKQ